MVQVLSLRKQVTTHTEQQSEHESDSGGIDEERRLSDESDSCWSYSGSDPGSEAELEVDSEPLALEDAVVVVTLGG